MWKSVDAVRDRIRRHPFMKPINGLGLLGQTVLASLVVLVAVTLGAPVGIVVVIPIGIVGGLACRPAGRASH